MPTTLTQEHPCHNKDKMHALTVMMTLNQTLFLLL